MLRSIVGWRRIDGEPWDETMRRMRDRIESGRQLHKWQLWSHRFFRDQWRFAVHLLAKMSQWMITYNCGPCFDEIIGSRLKCVSSCLCVGRHIRIPTNKENSAIAPSTIATDGSIVVQGRF